MEINEKRKKGVINRDVIVFAFFLLLSFTLWYLNDLGKETEAEIRYPVRFVNIPKGRLISEEPASRINLYLKGPGFSILKLKYTRSKTPVIIDLSKVTYRRVPDSKAPDYYILTSGMAKSIAVQLRSSCEVLAIKPDTLIITLGKGDVNASEFRK